jgi:hypothetical protein
VRIIVRADSGFARESIMAWCKENRVFYCLGGTQRPAGGASKRLLAR